MSCSYIISLEENAVEGTQLVFDGDLNVVQDLDKVRRQNYYECTL